MYAHEDKFDGILFGFIIFYVQAMNLTTMTSADADQAYEDRDSDKPLTFAY